MNLKLIHFEHALPPMAEMGLEHIIAPVLRALAGGNITGALITLEEEALAKVFKALASGADSRAARRLLAVVKASADELLAWEDDAAKGAEAVKKAALLDAKEVQEALSGFFGSLGLSLKPSQDSSVPPKEESAPADPATSGSSEPFSPLS